MEDEIEGLLQRLAYKIQKRRYPAPPFDFICDFPRRPLDGSRGPCLRVPWFSPAGRTAFSVKEGPLRKSDASDLKKWCRSARHSNKALLKQISGGVLVTNDVLPISKIKEIRKLGLYVWDIRRLLFYSAKARVISAIPSGGHAVESRFDLFEEASCLLSPVGSQGSSIVLRCDIFYDDHECDLSTDDVTDILRQTYRIVLSPVAKTSLYPIKAEISLHVLGMVNPTLARNSYDEFKKDQTLHRGVELGDTSAFRIWQYRPAAWASLL
jgi:hypothetical protein